MVKTVCTQALMQCTAYRGHPLLANGTGSRTTRTGGRAVKALSLVTTVASGASLAETI